MAIWQPVIAQEADAPAAEQAPDFVLRAVSGGNFRLSEFQGQVVALGFWARWCGDCRQAMQALNTLYDKYQRAGLVLLGIDVDDSLEQTRAMTRSLGLTFPVLVDDQKTVSNLFKVKSMPLIVLIDRAGQIRFQHKGYELGDQSRISDELRQLLNE
jgi:peroxiredoxin